MSRKLSETLASTQIGFRFALHYLLQSYSRFERRLTLRSPCMWLLAVSGLRYAAPAGYDKLHTNMYIYIYIYIYVYVYICIYLIDKLLTRRSSGFAIVLYNSAYHVRLAISLYEICSGGFSIRVLRLKTPPPALPERVKSATK